jgi:transposase
LALSAIYDGGARGDAARIGGVGLQIVRDWVVRFNAHGPAGLVDRHGPGASPLLSPAQLRALVEVVERGPIPAVHGVVRWRLVDLAQWIWEEFRISVSVQTISRQLRGLGYRKLSARPRHHAQAAGAIDHFKKASPQRWVKSRAGSVSSLQT